MSGDDVGGLTIRCAPLVFDDAATAVRLDSPAKRKRHSGTMSDSVARINLHRNADNGERRQSRGRRRAQPGSDGQRRQPRSRRLPLPKDRDCGVVGRQVGEALSGASSRSWKDLLPRPSCDRRRRAESSGLARSDRHGRRLAPCSPSGSQPCYRQTSIGAESGDQAASPASPEPSHPGHTLSAAAPSGSRRTWHEVLPWGPWSGPAAARAQSPAGNPDLDPAVGEPAPVRAPAPCDVGCRDQPRRATFRATARRS